MAFDYNGVIDGSIPQNDIKAIKRKPTKFVTGLIAAGLALTLFATGTTIAIKSAQKAKEENVKLEAQIGSVQSENQVLEILLDSYRNEIDVLQSKLENATTQEEKDALLDQIENLNASLAAIQADDSSKESMISAFQERIQDLENQLAQQNPADGSDTAKLEQEINRLKSQISVLSIDYDKLGNENDKLEQENDQLGQENDELRAQRDAANAQALALLDKYDLTEEEKQKYYDWYLGACDENTGLQNENENLRDIIAQLEARLNEQDDTIDPPTNVVDDNNQAEGNQGGQQDNSSVDPSGNPVADPANDGQGDKNQDGGVPGLDEPGQPIDSGDNSGADRTNDVGATQTGDSSEHQKSEGELAYESAINQTYANEAEFKEALQNIMTTYPDMIDPLKVLYGNQYSDLFPDADRDGGR